jgi:Protein of unknown function DUF262/HNH endonuclease
MKRGFMASKVNLDALIPREDFDIQDSKSQDPTSKIPGVSITDLKKESLFFLVTRKPDFQRETNEWDSEKICNFISSFLDGDLIPAIILWKSAGSTIFVIDGSHRISALVAWINDDYGDGIISKNFYDTKISDKQIDIASRTRILIKNNIGSFEELLNSLKHPEKSDPKMVARAKSLASTAIQLQWVVGDSTKAETSFFKINQEASPINPTEFKVLKARKFPIGIAARAIIRSGKGHKYWSKFSEEVQAKIQIISSEINSLVFIPDINSPIKTLDLPIGGKLYASQSLHLVLIFIEIVAKNMNTLNTSEEDTEGVETLRLLNYCKKILQRVNSIHQSSLGLHPAIYFYSSGGVHKPASFFAITALILDFESRDFYKKFISIRSVFEDLLLKSEYLVQQIVRKYRVALDGYIFIKDFYGMCIENLLLNKSIDETLSLVTQNPKFSYLKHNIISEEQLNSEFSRETKSGAFIREALKSAVKCKICGGYLHVNSISIDHIIRKEDGGLGSIDNAQLTHPYCNSAIKN